MPQSSSSIMPWLKLLRLPTVFTALTNVLCGFLITTDQNLAQIFGRPEFWLLLFSSAGLYLGGMVLNDVFDAALDAKERPDRPIPAGQISIRSATVGGFTLLTVGIICAGIADQQSGTGWTSISIAIGLAICVLLYDLVLKNTLASPIGMAACRFLNVMLGASCAGSSFSEVWTAPQLLVAGSLGIYVFGVTWFARFETGSAPRRNLLTGAVICLLGLGCSIACITLLPQVQEPRAVMVLVLVFLSVSVRLYKAIEANQASLLQKTVGLMLLQIIFIDTATVLALTGVASKAACVLILLIPARLLKRVIPMS